MPSFKHNPLTTWTHLENHLKWQQTIYSSCWIVDTMEFFWNNTILPKSIGILWMQRIISGQWVQRVHTIHSKYKASQMSDFNAMICMTHKFVPTHISDSNSIPLMLIYTNTVEPHLEGHLPGWQTLPPTVGAPIIELLDSHIDRDRDRRKVPI